MKEYTVTLTEDDLEFVKLAHQHYGIFAKAVVNSPVSEQERNRSAGIFRSQEFHAEQMIERITTGEQPSGEGGA